jgi:hypothetical protein
MSLFGDLRTAVLLRRLDTRLAGLERQLTRIADHLAGVDESREVPEATDTVRHTPPSDETLLTMERIEAHYQRVKGRPPSAEELARELDGEEYGSGDLMPGVREKLGL